ncbi:MAG TPA: glutathione S-transferase family protein [Solirubrobacteraceae bacterium]|jgi:glutathione S-transferase|nr:glutathione S-transferase family protein [Solirubrobacteraceae bacterium]
MLLYDSAISGNCYKVRLLLAQLGLDYERHELDVVDRSNRAQLLGDLNPALRVPTLVFDDGRSLAESNAILWYLAQGSAYSPKDHFLQAKVLQWLFFEQYCHEPNIAVLRFWLAVAKLPVAQAEIDAKRAAGDAALDALERQLALGAYIVGDAYTIADIALYAYTHIADEAGFDLADRPATSAWLARVAAQPGHVPIGA